MILIGLYTVTLIGVDWLIHRDVKIIGSSVLYQLIFMIPIESLNNVLLFDASDIFILLYYSAIRTYKTYTYIRRYQ